MPRIFLIEKDTIDFDFETSHHVAPLPTLALFLYVEQEPYRPAGVKLVAEPKLQIDKVKDAARELGADEDEKHWGERSKEIAKPKPTPEEPE